MTEYITKEQALKAFEKAKKDEPEFSRLNLHGLFYLELHAIEPADVVEVVRCKECVHHRGWNVDSFIYDEEKQKRVHKCEHKRGCYPFKINTPDDFYCGWGEKK